MQLGSVQSTAKWEWNRLPTGSWFFQRRLNIIVSSILPSCIKLDQIQIHHCVSFIHEAVAQRLRICARTAGKPVNFFQTIFSHWLVRSIRLLVLCPPCAGGRRVYNSHDLDPISTDLCSINFLPSSPRINVKCKHIKSPCAVFRYAANNIFCYLMSIK